MTVPDTDPASTDDGAPARRHAHRTARIGALIAAVAAAILASAPVAAVAGWSEPVQTIALRFTPAHSMVVDGNGRVHFGVEGGAGEGLFYVTNRPGPWRMTQVTDERDVNPSIALDSTGKVYIAFARLSELRPGRSLPAGLGGHPVRHEPDRLVGRAHRDDGGR